MKEIDLENSILTEDEKDELRRKKQDLRQRALDQQNDRREADPLLVALDATWDTLRLIYPQIALTKLAPGQLWESASRAESATQGPVKCLTVQGILIRAKKPSLLRRLDSLDRLCDGKLKTAVASFRAAHSAYTVGINEKGRERQGKAETPLRACQAVPLCAFSPHPTRASRERVIHSLGFRPWSPSSSPSTPYLLSPQLLPLLLSQDHSS